MSKHSSTYLAVDFTVNPRRSPLCTLRYSNHRNAEVESFTSLDHDQLRDLHPVFFERRWLGTDERVVHMRYHTCFVRLMHKQTSLKFATFETHVLCEYTCQEFCKVTACRSSLHRSIHHVLVLSEVERTFPRMSLLA